MQNSRKFCFRFFTNSSIELVELSENMFFNIFSEAFFIKKSEFFDSPE
jgi:hypothetical protein